MYCYYFAIFVAVLLVFDKSCSASGLGRCPKHELMEDFNITRFLGRWYEVERSFYLMELTSSCISIDLKENRKGQIDVAVRMRSRWSGSVKVSEGVASPTKKGPGYYQYKISTRLPNVFNRYLLPGAGYYQILHTDYDNYAIIWTCSNFGLAHTDLVWIWGRQQEIDAMKRAEIYGFLAIRHIDSERLVLPKNYNCTD